jgi:hypothetical protein
VEGHRLSGQDQTCVGDPLGDPLDSLIGLESGGDVEDGDDEPVIELAQGGGGGLLQAGDLGAEVVQLLAALAFRGLLGGLPGLGSA